MSADPKNRFQEIVVPILAKSAELYGTNPNPAIISITPGFWSLLRESELDKAERERRIASGESLEGIPNIHDSRTLVEIKETERQITETINLIADTFPKEQTRIIYSTFRSFSISVN